jgi:hypothetical protein
LGGYFSNKDNAMPGPIKPKEVQSKKDAALPEEVFEIFNALITEHWDGRSANFSQDEAVKRIAKALDISRGEAFKKGYLDVESAYRKAGWKVLYDKPGFNEEYEANFTFAKK